MGFAAGLAGCGLLSPCVDLGENAREGALPSLRLQRAFPDDKHVPAFTRPALLVAQVATDIRLPLGGPELNIRLGHGGVFASMPMPEAAAHIDDCFRLGNHHIGPSDKSPVAHPETPSSGMKRLAHNNFGQRIPAVNPRHEFAPLLWRYPIHCHALYHTSTTRRNSDRTSATYYNMW